MKRTRIVLLFLFLVATFATSGMSMEGTSSGIHHSFTIPMVQCADIVRAGILPPEQAGYLRSPEFAESMESVASGTSPYTPGILPAEWTEEASTWRDQMNDRSVFLSKEMTEERLTAARTGLCPSNLIFRASLDFRAKVGRPDMKPVYPYQVREASLELARRFERFAQRTRRIESSILEAERMGARDCSPSELSNAWAALKIAGYQAAENGFDVGKTAEAFANAEDAVAIVFAKRQVASNRMGICR